MILHIRKNTLTLCIQWLLFKLTGAVPVNQTWRKSTFEWQKCTFRRPQKLCPPNCVLEIKPNMWGICTVIWENPHQKTPPDQDLNDVIKFVFKCDSSLLSHRLKISLEHFYGPCVDMKRFFGCFFVSGCSSEKNWEVR